MAVLGTASYITVIGIIIVLLFPLVFYPCWNQVVGDGKPIDTTGKWFGGNMDYVDAICFMLMVYVLFVGVGMGLVAFLIGAKQIVAYIDQKPVTPGILQ